MLSAAPPPFSSRHTSPSLLRDVRVLYRRVCVLRASGKIDEAEALLSGKVAAAIASARESSEVSEQQLENIFASEEDRVDTAHALAEILLPLLTAANETSAALRNFGSPRPAESPRHPGGESGYDSTAPTTSQPAENNGANAGPMLPGIADFIDEMLTQERAPLESRNLRRPA